MRHFGSDGARALPLDFSGFAQEFLRRNRDYRQQYAALEGLAEFDPLAPKCREMARTWGLNFPDLPRRFRRGQSGDLAGGGRAGGHCACSRAAWSHRYCN